MSDEQYAARLQEQFNAEAAAGGGGTSGAVPPPPPPGAEGVTFTSDATGGASGGAELAAAAEEEGGEFNVFSYKEPPRHVGEGAWRGLKSLGTGVLAGATTLVAAPVMGAREEGAKGFAEAGLEVSWLNCTDLENLPDAEEIAAMIRGADIIQVSGGNTLFAVRRWRNLGVDKVRPPPPDRGPLACAR